MIYVKTIHMSDLTFIYKAHELACLHRPAPTASCTIVGQSMAFSCAYSHGVTLNTRLLYGTKSLWFAFDFPLGMLILCCFFLRILISIISSWSDNKQKRKFLSENTNVSHTALTIYSCKKKNASIMGPITEPLQVLLINALKQNNVVMIKA